MKPNKSKQIMLRCWGTRGSLPAPRPSTNEYGGNTPCVEIRVENQILIFDAGSGIRGLGVKLCEEFTRVNATIFITHYHWDHIQGFPFFAPAFVPGNRFVVYGEPRGKHNAKDMLAGQMVSPYFPVPLDAMKADIDFRDIFANTSIKVGSALIKTASLNHPGHALAYRIEYGGKSIVYATDTEHTERLDETLVQHARDADILIYDAMYTDEEYQNGKQGWGHSTWSQGVKLARAAHVHKLLLFHHDPNKDDSMLAAIEQRAKQQFFFTYASRENEVYIL